LTNTSAHKIAILGGGVSGISAAKELMLANYPFVLFEATGEIGGRASRIFDKTSEEYLDNGQHLLSGAYDVFLNLLEYLGTSTMVAKPKGLVVPYIDSIDGKVISAILDTTKAWGKAGTLKGLLEFALLSSRDKYSIIRLALIISLGQAKTNDSETCTSFLKRYKQTERAIEVFWEPLILAVLNTPISRASAVLLKRVCELAFFAEKSKASLLFPEAELTKLLSPITDMIKNQGSEIQLSTKIKRVETNEKGVLLVMQDGNTMQFSHVISALPPYTVNRAVDGFTIDNYQASPITSIFIWTDKELISDNFTALIGTRLQWIFNRTSILKIKHKISRFSYSFTVSASNELVKVKPEVLVSMVVDDLRKIAPDFTRDNIVHYRIVHEAMATFLATPLYENTRRQIPLSIDDKVFLAGDWTNTGLPGTLESAASSGQSAAQALIRSLGKN